MQVVNVYLTLLNAQAGKVIERSLQCIFSNIHNLFIQRQNIYCASSLLHCSILKQQEGQISNPISFVKVSYAMHALVFTSTSMKLVHFIN